MFETFSEWTPPTEFPDLSYAKYVGLDTETRDPNLQKDGPGFIRGDAGVVGVSLATETGFKIYLPFAHAQGPQLDKSQVVEYVRAQVSRPDQVKVGANLMYDLEALWSLGIEVRGPLADIQVAEPLLDEDRLGGYGLEALSLNYLGVGKTEDLLQEAADNWGMDKKRDLWMLPPKYVGPYAEDDALNPILILLEQMKQITKERLDGVWKLESDLTPVLWKMRRDGVRVDLDAAEQLAAEIKTEEAGLLDAIRLNFGGSRNTLDPWNTRQMYEALKAEGLESSVGFTKPTTQYPHGQPSITNEWLKENSHLHAGLQNILDYRNMNKMRRDFVEGLILSRNVRGRIHPQWLQLRANDEDAEGGTRTGRIASRKPNLMQIPARSPRWGKKVRSLFVADQGGKWCKNDYSAQEPRLILHFAHLKNYEGAASARQRYLDDIDTDYHQMTADLIKDRTGQDIGRSRAKTIGLGVAYGMGFYKLAHSLGLEESEARGILDAYNAGVPYVKLLEQRCTEYAQQTGFIRTYSGRKRRFDSWEAERYDRRGRPIKSYEDAVALYGKVVRAHAHKALNSLIQGTAADMTKQAIVDLDKAGLTPSLSVHDEICRTVYSDEEAYRIQEIMENALPGLTVPQLAEADVGDSWGSAKTLPRRGM